MQTSANEKIVEEDFILFRGQPSPYTGVLVPEPSYRKYETAYLQNEKCAETVHNLVPQEQVQILSLKSFAIGLGVGVVIENVFRLMLKR